MKYQKDKLIIEDNNENNRSVYLKEGFKELKVKPKTEKKAK